MTFQITGLDPMPFAHLHAMSDEQLASGGAQRVLVTEKPAAPCRISLDDAEIGESVILLNYTHQGADTPYHQQGPIFIRETNARFVARDVVPPALARRTLSLRGFDANDMMIEADLTEGTEAAALIERFFANPSLAYIHAHYARRGCFAALIERAA
ncbi:MAG: DUF1203 domain-containing protein [Alphaproteobacteria bacterium]|nr:DUF1203 domain-containing protein [Alphaproteobacteria bacterium]